MSSLEPGQSQPPALPPEHILADALLGRKERALGRALEALMASLSARFAILLRKEGPRWRALLARRSSGRPVVDPERLVDPGALQRISDGGNPAVDYAAGQGVWKAYMPVGLQDKVLGAVVLGGQEVNHQERLGYLAAVARRVSLYLACVLVFEDMSSENRRLRSLFRGPDGRETALFPAGYPQPARAILEYPLVGSVREESSEGLRSLFPEIVGSSAAIRGVMESILMAAHAEVPVLIEGESGTGKELVARAIHRLSRRAPRPFISENCGALPENLIESECFGHEKGAFTGAGSMRRGIFERAEGGTVFLDEIGEMELAVQRTLLRVLQEKEVRRVGGQEVVPVDFRILTATNRVLEEMVLAGHFRQDLYYRLNVVTIVLPPLRERPEDIPLLLEHFNRTLAGELGKGPLEFTGAAMGALTSYRWPGNVRELRNEVLRLESTGKGKVEPDCLSRRILRRASTEAGPRKSHPHLSLDDLEKEALSGVIIDALRSAGGNRAEAARKLGLSRASFYRRLVKYGLLKEADALHPEKGA
jgi:transcriptional regulator with GAF, ATPase, and Fis domain